MGTSYDKFLKKFNKGFQERKINRVVKRTQPYGRGLGKSHKQYIAGDIVSSASNRAYGYKMNGITPINQFTGGQDPYLYKKQQEGENPYEFKYVYTGIPTWVKGGTSSNGKKYKGFWSRNRMATDEEKDLYKKTGDLDFERADRKVNYSVMRGHNEKADNFKEHLNTPVWDGLEVANNRVKNGGSKFEYLKGFLKDVAVDPLFDTLKTFDKYESALTGSIGGVIEESRNVFDAFADKDMSKIDFKRPIKNAQESFSESDKTGWGKSMGDFFSEAVDRRDERELARLKSLPQNAYTKLQIKNIKEKQENKVNEIFEKAVGFAGDITSPVNLGTGVIKAGKKITGNTVDAFNDLRKGTADLSMGIVPKHIREANQKKAMKLADDNMFNPLKPKTGESVTDILHETKPMNDLKLYDDYKLDGVLKQGYKNAMNNDIDKVIKSNPATQNLGKFLDDIKPQKSPVIDDFENLFEASDVPNSRLGKDLFFKKIDNLPDRESDEVLDWLAEYNPKVYNEYLDGVDDLDEFADGLAKEQKIDDILDEKIENERNHRYFEGSQQNSLSPEIAKRYDAFNPSLSEQEKINQAYEKLQKYRMLNNKKFITSKIKTPNENMKTFVDKGREFIDDISKLSSNDLKELSKLMDSFTKVDDNLRRDEIVSYLNDLMFDGEKVLLNTIRPKDLEQLTTHLADLVDYKLAKANGFFSFKPRVPGNNAKDGIHYFSDRNGKENKFFDKLNMFSPASADELFNDKMSDLSSFFGVKNKSELTTPLRELKAKLKKGEDLTPDELIEYDRLSEAVNRWNDLYKNNIKNMDFDEYQKFRKEELGFKDGYEEYVEKHMKQYSDFDVNRKDFVKNIEDARSYRNKTGKQTYEKINPYEFNGYDDDAIYKPKDAIEEGYIKAEKDEMAKKQRMFEDLVDLHKELKIPLPKVKNANVKISAEQKLSKIPDVAHNTGGLRKVIENEMEMMYKNPTKYEKHKDTLKNMKKEFVNALRSYGVKDEQYFKKVKALQDDLDLYYKELNKPSSLVKKSSEGGQGTPKLGMNLQLLAERINKGLDDLDIKYVKKSPLSKFKDGVRENLKNSDLPESTINSVIENKTKRYLRNKGISKDSPLYKNFKFNKDDLPSSSAKRLENGNIINKSTGEVKYSKENKSVLNEIKKNNKYHYANKEENEMLENFLSNSNPKPEHFISMFEKMNISFDINDPESVERAFKRFDWIIDKKIKDGSIGANKANRIYDADTLKSFEHSPLEVLTEKLAEAHKYGDDVSANYLNKLIHDRGTNEIIGEIKKANNRSDKEELYRRLMQQSEYAYDSNNSLNYYEEMSDWLMNQGGLDVREKNDIIDFMKKEQIKLANKGIDPNVIENPGMRKSMNAQQYSHRINRDFEQAEAVNKDMKNIIEKEKNRKVNPSVLDKFEQKGTILEEIKSGKPKKRIRAKEAEERVAKNLELDKSMYEFIKKTKAQREKGYIKIDDGIVSKIEPPKKSSPRTADDMLKNELSETEIASTLDEDLTRMEKEIKDEKSLFNRFKKNFEETNPHMKYEDSKIYDIYKRWLNTWKKGLTVYNPGWHLQNFFQNKGQNYLAFGNKAFGSQKNAKNLLNYLQGGVDKVEKVIDKKNGVVYDGNDLKSLVKRLKVVNSQTNDIMESRGVIPFLETKIDNSKLMKKLGHSEDTSRLYHFITQLERGMSPEDASKSVNKYLFDYDKKNKFDKVIGDFVDPFWVFHKNYAKLLGKTALENPSAINKVLRSERGLESGLAESERNNTSTNWDKLQSPYSSFKDEKNGKMYDYLYKQNIMPRIQDAIPTNQDEVENKLNPILRLLLQQSRNEGNFHNKIVDKDKAGWNEVTKEDRTKEVVSELNPFLNSLVKASVNSNKHQKSADEGRQSQSTSDKQILLDWIQFITGNKGNYYKR